MNIFTRSSKKCPNLNLCLRGRVRFWNISHHFCRSSKPVKEFIKFKIFITRVSISVEWRVGRANIDIFSSSVSVRCTCFCSHNDYYGAVMFSSQLRLRMITEDRGWWLRMLNEDGEWGWEDGDCYLIYFYLRPLLLMTWPAQARPAVWLLISKGMITGLIIEAF